MLEESESRILAIDYGIKRIGLALSDSLKLFAYPFKTIPNEAGLLTELKEIINSKGVIKIILGLPAESRSSSTSVVSLVKEFKEKLEKEFKLEVELWDETYTSAIAQQRIIESVNKKQKRKNKGLLDMHSAAIILQEYLDAYKNK